MAYEKLKQEHFKNLGGINTFQSQYQTGDAKFLDLRNYTFERPGKLSSRPGTEYHLTLNSGTYLARPTSSHQYTKRDGSSFILFDSGPTLSAYNGSFIPIGGSLTANATTSAVVDFETFDNLAFFANGNVFGRFDGTTFSYFNLIQADGGQTLSGITFHTSLIAGYTATIASGTYMATFQFARGYADIYQGPFYDPAYQNAKGLGQAEVRPTAAISVGSTVVSRGRWLVWGFSLPGLYGISGILPYLKLGTGSSLYMGATPVTAYLTTFGGGTTFWAAEFDHPVADAGFNLGRNNFTSVPQYLSIYNNHLMMAGFSDYPSMVHFSEPGEPDNVAAENFFEVRTSEGDRITGLEVFQDSLVIFKNNGVFELAGSTADSFQLRELSLEYGLTNNRAKVVFENRLWFLDKSGIFEYDGANFRGVSDPVSLYLDQMDKSQVHAVHIKKKRQVWFCSSGVCLVYDYNVGAWTIYDRLEIDADSGAIEASYGSTRSDLSFWKTGASFHEFIRFGDSLSTDLGSAITLLAQTRFHKRLEHTTQELWRRVFANFDVPGSTLGLTMQLLPDYGTSVYATKSTYLDAFQKRIEFGVSSRSLSVKFILQASEPIKFNGYALESRFLRRV